MSLRSEEESIPERRDAVAVGFPFKRSLYSWKDYRDEGCSAVGAKGEQVAGRSTRLARFRLTRKTKERGREGVARTGIVAARSLLALGSRRNIDSIREQSLARSQSSRWYRISHCSRPSGP